jgi:hypothetical protein
MDNLISDLVAFAPSGEAVDFASFPIADFQPEAPSNPVSAAKTERNRLTRSILAATANETKAGAKVLQLDSFQGGSAPQVAAYDEAVAEAAAITAQKDAMTARKNELDAFIAANGG